MPNYTFVEYKLNEILPCIFHFSTENAYDLGMTFLRYQEYYENPEWKGRVFTIFEFMDWYVKKNEDTVFTYPNDWGGYNIPSWVIYELQEKIPDWNPYDNVIREVTSKVENKFNVTRKSFYLIGTSSADEKDERQYIKHEIAHGLFFTDERYKQEMLEEVKNIPKKLYKDICGVLHGPLSYHPDVFDDEIQAYLSTGLVSELKEVIPKEERTNLRKPFKKIFNKYTKNRLI